MKSRDQIYNELLVLKCQAGDSQAIEELVDRWQKQLWHYAYQVTGSEPVAWDVVQETWVAIIKGIRKLEDAAVFPRWAFRIANNKCSDWLRKQQRQRKLADELSNQAKEQTKHLSKEWQARSALNKAIKKLAPDQRSLITLRYGEGFNTSEIARILDVPEGTVKSRLHRTLEKLRQTVEQT